MTVDRPMYDTHTHDSSIHSAYTRVILHDIPLTGLTTSLMHDERVFSQGENLLFRYSNFFVQVLRLLQIVRVSYRLFSLQCLKSGSTNHFRRMCGKYGLKHFFYNAKIELVLNHIS